ncbi:MAG: UvrD-helicase domain-containing protein, partial [Bacteroidales bacterium]
MANSMKTFEVKKIALENANLIEASAGTGKTYSIAILALRLLLEKSIPIDRILMVTFTNKAVAELEMRIRSFIREAYNFAFGEKQEKDQTICDIVTAAKDKQGEEEIKALLTDALRQLDEVQISTIHSFCQNTISQFALETDQPFKQEIIANTDEIINDAMVQYRREKLNTIADQNIFDSIHSELNYDTMESAVMKVMDGKKYFEGTKDIPSTDLETLFKKKDSLKIEILGLIDRDYQLIGTLAFDGRTTLRKSYNKNIETFKETYISEFDKSSDKLPHFESLKELHAITKQYIAINEAIKLKPTAYVIDFINYAIQKVEAYKRRTDTITYDDLILCIRKATESNASFRKEMAAKYDAVFIDEFQDTDANQYTIFKMLYADFGKIVFYIGDPKQSIYGFRKADLDVYKQAKRDIGSDHLFTMNNNFRGT